MDVLLPSKRAQFGIGKFFFNFHHKVSLIVHFYVEAYYVTLVPTGLNVLLYIIDTVIIHRKDIECNE